MTSAPPVELRPSLRKVSQSYRSASISRISLAATLPQDSSTRPATSPQLQAKRASTGRFLTPTTTMPLPTTPACCTDNTSQIPIPTIKSRAIPQRGGQPSTRVRAVRKKIPTMKRACSRGMGSVVGLKIRDAVARRHTVSKASTSMQVMTTATISVGTLLGMVNLVLLGCPSLWWRLWSVLV